MAASKRSPGRRRTKSTRTGTAPKYSARRPPKRGGARRSAAPSRQVGFAVVGLGHIAQAAVLPAFKHAKNAKLVALVSGEREKLDALSKKHRVKHTYGYDELDDCLRNEEVDAVYIALPNDQHRDYAVRAAKAGVHVLCEKPMALDERQCEEMIQAARESGVRLMIAYRLHFEPANLEAVEVARSGKLGELKYFSSEFSFQVQGDNIRVEAERGGGPLWDIGVYCINAARYIFRDEPEEVFAFSARGDDPRFSEVDEAVSAVMRFPDERLASFTVSFGAAPTATYRLVGTEGDLRLENAYEYVGERTLRITVNERTRKKQFRPVDQFGPELQYFAECVLEGRDPEPNGHEGLADVRIIRALLESIESGRPVPLEPVEQRARPGEAQKFQMPPVDEPELVNVEQPHQG